MAYIIGYVSSQEKKALKKYGWDIEDASEYNLIGDNESYLMGAPRNNEEAIVICTDNDVDLFQIMRLISGYALETDDDTE